MSFNIKEQIAEDLQEGKIAQEEADSMLELVAMLEKITDEYNTAEQAKEEMFEAVEGNLDKGEATIVVLDLPEEDGIQVIQYSNPRKTVELLVHAIGNIAGDNPEVLVDVLTEIVEELEE